MWLLASASWASPYSVDARARDVGGHSLTRWPELNLIGLEGQAITLAAGPAKVTLVDFWASWCAPCRLSFPWMNKLHDRFREQGLRVVAINLDRRRDDAVRFLAAHPARFEIALDPTAKAATALNVQAMPTSMLVRKDGTILWIHRGFRESDVEGLERRILEALT